MYIINNNDTLGNINFMINQNIIDCFNEELEDYNNFNENIENNPSEKDNIILDYKVNYIKKKLNNNNIPNNDNYKKEYNANLSDIRRKYKKSNGYEDNAKKSSDSFNNRNRTNKRMEESSFNKNKLFKNKHIRTFA